MDIGDEKEYSHLQQHKQDLKKADKRQDNKTDNKNDNKSRNKTGYVRSVVGGGNAKSKREQRRPCNQ